jgi:hypothetical protein
MSLTSTVHVVAFSTTGRVPINGKVDTCFAVRTSAQGMTKTWVIPLKIATMNQAALLGTKFGILSVQPMHRENLRITTDNPYVAKVLAKKKNKEGREIFPLKPESNAELVDEIRKLYASIKEPICHLNVEEKTIVELRAKVRVHGKQRLA